MQMPLMDGVTLAKAIRERYDELSLPFVLLTSLGQYNEAKENRLFAKQLTKPIKAIPALQCVGAIICAENGRFAHKQSEQTPNLTPKWGKIIRYAF